MQNKPPWEIWSANVYHLLLTQFDYTEEKAEVIVYGKWTDSVYDMWKEGHDYYDALKIITNPEQTWNL